MDSLPAEAVRYMNSVPLGVCGRGLGNGTAWLTMGAVDVSQQLLRGGQGNLFEAPAVTKPTQSCCNSQSCGTAV